MGKKEQRQKATHHQGGEARPRVCTCVGVISAQLSLEYVQYDPMCRLFTLCVEWVLHIKQDYIIVSVCVCS